VFLVPKKKKDEGRLMAVQAILKKNLNIVDLMASMQLGEDKIVQPCATEKELAAYPLEKTDWFFPNLEDLSTNQGMLLFLLRELEGRGRFRGEEKKKPQPSWEVKMQEESNRGPLDMMGQLIII
jgi:hypothetical protein